MSEKKSLYESPGAKGNRGLPKPMVFIITTAYVRRQHAGSQDFGDKRMSEDQTDYVVSPLEEEGD